MDMLIALLSIDTLREFCNTSSNNFSKGYAQMRIIPYEKLISTNITCNTPTNTYLNLELLDLIGEKSFTALSNKLAGKKLCISPGYLDDLEEQKSILDEALAGKSNTEIAKKHHISIRQVIRIKQRAAASADK